VPNEIKPPALDPVTIEPRTGTSYPAQFAGPVENRQKRALGDPLGLTQFGVNLVTLPPGCWSSLRHWHSAEDEFVYVISGEISLVTNAGEQRLRPGMVAGFPAGNANGHHLINNGSTEATYLEVGTREAEGDEVDYPDIDMMLESSKRPLRFTNREGEPY